MQRIMPARVSVLNCEVKRRKTFKQLILLCFPMHGAIECTGGVGLYVHPGQSAGLILRAVLPGQPRLRCTIR
jgi:hypothetical protein